MDGPQEGADSLPRRLAKLGVLHSSRVARVFLLSPARLDGRRAQTLFFSRSDFAIASGLRTPTGVEIGQVYAYLSALYFRGKLAYAEAFAAPPPASWIGSGVLVITPNRGLVPAETRVVLEQLESFAETDIRKGETRFTVPLRRDARMLFDALAPTDEVVLLGSVANPKYTAPLLEVLGDRLLFPREFVGRGDMSRGGLLLRATRSKTWLSLEPVKGAVLHGKRPPKLPRREKGQ